MYTDSLYAMMRQLYSNMMWQNEKLLSMEKMMQQLQKEVEELKLLHQKTSMVDRIEYKFDQLKVEKLEGTLNIGITPQGVKTLEDFTVNDHPLGKMNPVQPEYNPSEPNAAEVEEITDSENFRSIRQEVYQYIQHDLPMDIKRLEQQHNMILGSDYRQMVYNDIQKQVEKRILYYINEMNNKALHEPDTIVNKVKNDIHTALVQHFKEKEKDKPQKTSKDNREQTDKK